MLAWKWEQYMNDQNLKKLEEQVEKKEKAKEKLSEELEEINQKIESIKKSAEDNHQAWISAFKKSIRPLDDASILVEEQKDKMEQKISETQIAIQQALADKET